MSTDLEVSKEGYTVTVNTVNGVPHVTLKWDTYVEEWEWTEKDKWQRISQVTPEITP